MIIVKKAISIVASASLAIALAPAIGVDGAGKAFAEPVAKEFAIGDSSTGYYYYRTVESSANGSEEIASDTQARLIAIDLRGTDSNFDGQIDIPATVTDDGKEYLVTSVGGKTPNEFKAEGIEVHTDSNPTLFLAENDTTNAGNVGVGYKNNDNLSKVKTLKIGKNVEKLGGCSFTWCQNLQDVQFEKGGMLSEMGREAFGYDTSLVSIHEVGTEVEDGTYDLERLSHLATMGTRPFGGCTQLKELRLPASLTTMGTPNYGASAAGAFYAHTVSFQQGSLLSEIPVFGSGALAKNYEYYSPNLERIDFGGNAIINAIPLGAFRGLTKLHEVNLPSNLVTIGQSAFQDCASLGSIEIPASVTDIGNNAFRACATLLAVRIPNSVTKFGTGVFWGCAGLEDAATGDGPEQLQSTFNQCTGLKKVDVGSAVATIGQRVFGDCISLESVVVHHKGILSLQVAESNGKTYSPFMLSASKNPSESVQLLFERGDTTADIVDVDGKTFSTNDFFTKRLDVYGNSESLKATCESIDGKARYTDSGTTGAVSVVYHEIVDATALNEALAAAPEQVAAAKAKYVVADDAAEVAAGTQFVTPEAVDTLDAAIVAAQAVADDATATEEQVKDATDSIAAAIKAFEDSAAEGANKSMAADAVIAELPAAPAANASAADAAAYKEAVNKALAAYDALTDEEKAAVSKLSALLAAQRAVAARDAADAEAATKQAADDLKAAQDEAKASADKVTQLEGDLKAANEATAAAKAAAAKTVTLAKPVLTNKTKSAKKGKVTATWKKVAGATGYELKVGSKTYTVKKATTLKKTVKAKKGKKVKVQVRAYKKQGTNMLYSAWSKAKKVKVKK